MEHKASPDHNASKLNTTPTIPSLAAPEDIHAMPGKAGAILMMQRVVGNQAVQRMMRGQAIGPQTNAPVIQRRGTYEPLDIKEATNAQAIEEQEWGRGKSIALSKITSCIGFIARVGNDVFGVHLSVMDANEKQVTTVDVQDLKGAMESLWPAGVKAVVQVGMSNNWRGPVMQQALFPVVYAEPFGQVDGEGVYSAVVNGDGKLEVSKDGKLAYTELAAEVDDDDEKGTEK